jgi:hypothetical protein
MKKIFLGLTTFLLIPIAVASISFQVATPFTERANKNWGGLLVSPGDIIILKALAIGLMIGLMIGLFVYRYFVKKIRR